MAGVSERYRGRHVRVFALDHEALVQELRVRAARLVAERQEVVEVRLFGSLARAQAAPGSDADVLVVVRQTARPFVDRADELRPYFEGLGVGCDVLVYSEAEVSPLAAAPPLARAALVEGLVLARR